VVDDMVVKINHGEGGEGGRESESEGERKVLVNHGVGDHHEGARGSATHKGGNPGMLCRVCGRVERVPRRMSYRAGNRNPIGVCIRAARYKRPPIGFLNEEDIGGRGSKKRRQHCQATANIDRHED
jgi:hypothetical protein